MNSLIQINLADESALPACREQLGCHDLALGLGATLLVARARGEGKPAAGDGAGQIVGCAICDRQFFGRPFLSRVFVAAPHRRRGVASHLVRRFEAQAAGQTVFTSTNISNAPARSLFAALGYMESGVIFNLDPGDPELVLVKRL